MEKSKTDGIKSPAPNYTNLTPRLWIEKSKGNDLQRETYLDSYISDCQHHSNFNARIPSPTLDVIRVCSYNVHKWMYPNNKHENVEDVLAVIEKINPHVIGFQEVANLRSKLSVWKDLEELDYNYRTDANTNVECPTMIVSKLLIDDITPAGINKIASVGLFTSPKNVEFVVCNLHLDARDTKGEKRRKELGKIIECLDPKYPTIIIGDFNALKVSDYGEEEKQWLARHNQSNPLDFETITMIEENGFRDTFDVCTFKYSTWSARRVDFIFTRGISAENIVNTGVFYTTSSDHLPIFSDFII